MLFERTAISKKPEELSRKELQALTDNDRLSPDLVFQNPYVLDFLGLKDTFLEKTEGSAIRRIGHEQWLRNIAVALGNAKTTPEVVAALKSRQHGASDMVTEHVTWALAQHAQGKLESNDV